MTNQVISLAPTVKSKPVIGMMRHFARPNHLAVAAAFAAKMIDCEFFFFTPNDINFNNRKIEGFFYEDGQWVKRLTDFPDVVDNSPSRNSTRAIYEELEKHVPLTMRRIGNKNIVNKRILDDGVYSDLMIPSQLVEDLSGFSGFINKYEKVIINATENNQDNVMRFVEKNNGTYIVHENYMSAEVDENQLMSYVDGLIKDKYIVQAHINSITKEGLPFDIRIHVRRGREGKWSIIKIYPRIGLEAGFATDLNQASTITNMQPFMLKQFQGKSIEIEKQLKQLAVEFPDYFQKFYQYPLDALGLDVKIDEEGEIWISEVDSYPCSKMFELESQQVAMEYAKYIANATEKEEIITGKNDVLIQVDEERTNKKVIGMFSPVRSLSKLKTSCAAVGALYGCEFFYFTPKDINFEEKKIIGRIYYNGEWINKSYNYTSGIDVIYDRIRLIGRPKYAKEYKALEHIPFTHNGFNRSLNKLLVYDKFYKESSLQKYLIPYENYKNPTSTTDFLEKYKKIIVKPHVGFGGADLFYIVKESDTIKIIQQEKELAFSVQGFKEWLGKVIGDTPYVLQKYINTRTIEGRPFDVRVHMMRNYKNTWDFVEVYPRVGIGFEKSTLLEKGGYIGQWKGFVVRNFGEEEFKRINEELRSVSRKIVKVFEKEFEQQISEVGIDFGISREGELYLIELNLLRPELHYHEFSVAQRAIGYAQYLAEQNSRLR